MKVKGFTITLLVLLLCYGHIVSAKVIKIATLSPDGTAWMKAMRAGAKEIKRKNTGSCHH